MKLTQTISRSKLVNGFIGGFGYLLILTSVVPLAYGLLAAFSSLIEWDTGAHGVRAMVMAFGFGGGLIMLFLGLIGIKISQTSGTNL